MDSKYIEANSPPPYTTQQQQQGGSSDAYRYPQQQQQPATYAPIQVTTGYPQVIVSTTTTTGPQQGGGSYYVQGVVQQQPANPPASIEGQFDGAYFKSGSAICRIILIIILLVGCITMGRVNYLNFIYDISSYYWSELLVYFNNLKTLRQSYLACASILIVIQVLKIMLNAFNYGEWNTTVRPSIRNVNISISVIESLFMLGFSVVFVFLNYYGFFLYLIPDYATAMIMVILACILRSIIGCVEGCRARQRLPLTQPQVVIVQQQQQY